MNSGILAEDCTVKYLDFNEAVQLCVCLGRGSAAGKSDMSAAFRHVPLSPDTRCLLIMKPEHPVTKKLFYFVDKCLPFGSSIICSPFQNISDAIAHIVRIKTGKQNVNLSG